MAIDLALANAVLQNHYLPGFQTQINDKMSYFYKLIEKMQQTTGGEQFIWLARYGRSGGKGSVGEGDDLPTAFSRSKKQVTASPKNFYARMQLSDRLIKASKHEASFLEELSQQMEELLLDSKDDLSRQLYGTGSGLIATLTANTTAGTDITVSDAKFLNAGISIEITDTTETTTKATVRVVDVDKVTNVVTVDANVTVIIGDKIFQESSRDNEITGLGALMQRGNTVYNIDRASNAWFDPNVFTLGGSNDLDDDYMEYAFQTIDLETGEKPDMIVAGYSAFRNLKDYLSAYQRYHEIATRYDAGHMTMHYNGVPVEQDKYQTDTTMDFLCTEFFKLMHIGENFSWLDMDGSVLNRVPNKAAYEATLVLYAELCLKYPKAQFRYTNIQKTTFTPA